MVTMKPLLEVTRRMVVTVNSTNGRRSGVGEVTFIVGVAHRTRMSVALLTEAWLVWRSHFGTLRVDAAVCAVFVLLSTSRVKASVVFGTIVGRALHRTV